LRGDEIVEVIEKFDELYGENFIKGLVDNADKNSLVMYLINVKLARGEL